MRRNEKLKDIGFLESFVPFVLVLVILIVIGSMIRILSVRRKLLGMTLISTRGTHALRNNTVH